MYIPKHFILDDRAAACAVIEDHDFGLLITAADGRPSATHLPFLYRSDEGAEGTLYAHMARANPQWRDFAEIDEALAIFQGPHAYVSPRDYASDKPNVPTWNYIAVHAYGRPVIISDAAEVAELLTVLTARHENARPDAWSPDDLPDGHFAAMSRGIVAFRIAVTRLEAKAKLSQNKTEAERLAAAQALGERSDPLAQHIGRAMGRAD